MSQGPLMVFQLQSVRYEEVSGVVGKILHGVTCLSKWKNYIEDWKNNSNRVLH